MKRIFPSAGKFDEIEYAKVADLSDRNKVYKDVADAESKIAKTDRPKLIAVMKEACGLIDQSRADAKNLKLVFGTKHAVAKALYLKARDAINNAILNLDKAVDMIVDRLGVAVDSVLKSVGH